MEDVKYNFNSNISFVSVDGIKYQGGYIFNITLNTFVDYKMLMASIYFFVS